MRIEWSVWVIGLMGIVATAAQAAEPLPLAADPALSPDGSVVAFRWRGDVWTVPVEGGAARQLTQHPARDGEPAFSPDGTRVAFTSERSGSRQVYVASAEGGTPEQCTDHTAGYALEEWFPDGEAVLVSGSRDHYWRHAERFFKVAIEKRTADKLCFNAYGSDARLSPDGKKMLFAREGERWWRKGYKGPRASQIWLYDFATEEFTKVADDGAGCRWPLWKPDGSGFYFVCAKSGAFNLWEKDLAGGGARQLTEFEDDSVVFPCISRDGSTIVFRHLFDLYRFRPGEGAKPARIEVVYEGDEVSQPVERRNLERATEVAYSKDGLEVAFIAGGDLWVMDTELREPRQITETPEEERDPVFAPDGGSILYVSDAEGQSDIWKAERGDGELYWWQNEAFKLERVTCDAEVESDLSWSPDGAHVAFVKGLGELWIMQPDGKEAKKIVASWNAPEYDWSPDGQWIVYALSDNDFNRDIWLLPIDGSRERFNLSRHPDNESHPVWSPDGKVIAFTGRRVSTEVDIYFVFLRAEDDEKSARERTLEKALEKINKVRKKKGKGQAEPKQAAPSGDAPDAGDNQDENGEQQDADEEEADKQAEERDKLPEVAIDFEGIHERLRRVSIPDATERGLFWSHDSKKLAFAAEIDGRSGTYTIAPPEELEPKLLATQTGSQGRWIAQGNQIVWLSGGVPASLSAEGKATAYRFTARQELDIEARNRAAFDLCWRTMRDRYYDARLGNRNWDAIRRKYVDAAAQAADSEAFATVVHLMLGELNGSHLGFTPSRRGPSEPNGDAWSETTAHFGLRFEGDYNGPGLKVRDVIPESPAAMAKSHIEPGEIVLSIDGTTVDPAMDLTAVVNGRLDRDVTLRVRGRGGEDREVKIRPISFGAARALLYEKWVRDNREKVEELSEGKLGYLHIRGMNMPSFYRFEEELYSAGAGKEGLVIDVRENGGGFTTDHLLTALTQPVHAITVPRGGGPGYPQDRRVYATWHKPIVVLCNQNSFSNAEIFSHAIKTLGRGPLVGVATAGGVISTGATRIMDLGILRIPHRGWFVLGNGEDMELHGAVPQHVVWPEPGELPEGKDTQLCKAVEVLSADVEAWKARPRPELRKATERANGNIE